MKKFRFKLEPLLKVTRMKREDAEVAFAEASRKLEEAREQLGEMLADMQRSQQKFDKLARNGAKLPMERIVAYHQFFNYKRRQIEQQNRLILERRGKKQQKMKELMDLMSYVKSIEQLRERKLQEYKDEAMHEEQKLLDEPGQQLVMRRKGAAS